ncbi:50S ribosomal protein L29 [Desulfurispira natronophila]|uniref:Large ribosomal subunit protein uL29 n=1 Tax=Desulfurispira natronophila TaxID=682562 RepID=A0A7W8DHL3_9BACT|nr:50S ribosomal protein L29 [Desulfurispira natronophila]MBB5022413.1 large subunit ribosomal protein L29 [Desulfurispira natronophila]
MMDELKEMSVEDLQAREQELRQELFHLRYQLAMNQLEDTASIKKKRREVARIKTILGARAQQEVAAAQ